MVEYGMVLGMVMGMEVRESGIVTTGEVRDN